MFRVETNGERRREMSKERRKVEWSLDFDNMRVRAGQFVTEMMGEPPEVKEARLHEALAGVESCRVEIAFSVGHASIKALGADSPNLFEANLRYVGELDYDVSGGAQRRIRLGTKANFPNDVAATLGKAEELRWEIGLARHVPLQLELRGGLGEAELDLSQLTVEKLKLDTGLGKAALTLPAGKQVTAEIRGGVGMTELSLPAGAFGRLKIKGGVGQARIQAVAGSALRLEGKTGLGVIDLPKSLIQVEGGRMKGAWQTADFEAAERQTVIEYVGGVGLFALEFVESQ